MPISSCQIRPAETFLFEADKVEGSILEPVVLTADSIWGGDAMPAILALSRSYPNPFGRTTTISYDVPAGGGGWPPIPGSGAPSPN